MPLSIVRIHALLAQGAFDEAALELERLESDFQLNDENSVLVWALVRRMSDRNRIGNLSSEAIALQKRLLTDRIKLIIDEVERSVRDGHGNEQHSIEAATASDSTKEQDLVPRAIVICEGSSVGNRRKDFDAQIYTRILGRRFPEVRFISGGSSDEIAKARTSVRQAFATVLPNTKIVALCDRDDKSPEEVADFEKDGGIVLTQRNLESFLLADDVITALLIKNGKQNLKEEALEIKRAALANSVTRKNAPDDLKSAAGDIYVGLKRLLSLTQSGNTAETFMRDTLSPLVCPPMPSYDALKAAVIDRITG